MTQRQSQVNVSDQNQGLDFEQEEHDLASKKGYLTIHKFAQICRTTPRTIRFYDQKGLLKPKFIDKWTSYRYYDPRQANEFLLIRFMQNLQIPLSQIKINITVNAADQYVDEKLKSLEKEIVDREKEYKFLKNLKSLLFEEKKLNQVFKREVIGPFNVFCLKIEHGSYDSVNVYRQQLRDEAKKLKLDVDKRDIIQYLNYEYRPKDTSLEFMLICKKDYSKSNIILSENYSFKTFPKTKALVYNYQGLNSFFILIYQRLFKILEKYKIKLKGHEFDINLESPDAKLSAYDYKTKLVFPI